MVIIVSVVNVFCGFFVSAIITYNGYLIQWDFHLKCLVIVFLFVGEWVQGVGFEPTSPRYCPRALPESVFIPDYAIPAFVFVLFQSICRKLEKGFQLTVYWDGITLRRFRLNPWSAMLTLGIYPYFRFTVVSRIYLLHGQHNSERLFCFCTLKHCISSKSECCFS